MAAVAKTSGAKGLHVFVPLAPGPTFEEVAAATRAVAARAERLDPELATTAFIRADRGGQGLPRLDPRRRRHRGRRVQPRLRPGTPVSFPVDWADLDAVTPADFTVRTVLGLARRRRPVDRADAAHRSASTASWSRRARPSR